MRLCVVYTRTCGGSRTHFVPRCVCVGVRVGVRVEVRVGVSSVRVHGCRKVFLCVCHDMSECLCVRWERM